MILVQTCICKYTLIICMIIYVYIQVRAVRSLSEHYAEVERAPDSQSVNEYCVNG